MQCVVCVCFWPFRRLEEDLRALELMKLKAIVTHSMWFWAPNMGKNSICLTAISPAPLLVVSFFTLKVIPGRCQLLRIHRRLLRWLRYRLTAMVPSAHDHKNWGKQATFLWWQPGCQFPSLLLESRQFLCVTLQSWQCSNTDQAGVTGDDVLIWGHISNPNYLFTPKGGDCHLSDKHQLRIWADIAGKRDNYLSLPF